VDRVESRLVNTSIFLTQGGKQQMVNSVLSSLPTFLYVFHQDPSGHFEIDRYISKALSLEERGGGGLVTRPKMKGGLRIIKLGVHNDTLLMKNLDKFFNNHDLP
jgi:hypothetical protein